MPDLGKLLKDEFKGVAARQLRTTVGPLQKELRDLRRHVSQQQKLTRSLERRVSRLTAEADERRANRLKASNSDVQTARVRPTSIRRARERSSSRGPGAAACSSRPGLAVIGRNISPKSRLFVQHDLVVESGRVGAR